MKINQKKAGIVLSYLSQGIHILSGLLYTPLMFRLLGQSEYGLYQMVSSAVSCLSLLSFGFSGAYMRFYSRLRADKDEEGIAKLNGMFLSVFLLIALLCIICGSVMTANIHRIFADGLTEAEYSRARVLMVLMVGNLALTFPNSVFDAFTSAHEQFVFQKLLLVFQYLFHPFITLPLLLMGYGSVSMVVVTTGLTITKLLANVWFSRHKLKVRFCFRHFNFSLLLEMWGFTFFIFINMIIDQINWSVDKLLIGRFMGTAAVAVYGVGAQLNTIYIQFSTAVSNVFIPQVNRIVAESDDRKQLTELFAVVGRLQYMVLGLILSAYLLFGRAFIQIWAGKEYEKSWLTAVILMVPETIPLIQNIGIEIQRAKNMHQARSLVYLAIAVGNIAISIPLIRLWGVWGAALGTAITLVVGNGIFMNWYYHRCIGLDIGYFWGNIFRLLPAMAPPVFAGIWMAVFLDLRRISVFCLTGLTYTIIYIISMLAWGLTPRERKELFERKHG